MSYAYIVFPDVLLDALENDEDNENAKSSKFFLAQLLKEKLRVCTIDSKKFRGFIAYYHWKCLVEIIVELINNENITDEEINLIQLVLEAVDRDGIEDYPYKENYTPILDLAKDKSDSYEIIIVCNNNSIIQKIKQFMQQPHFGKYYIFNSEEAFLHILNH